MAPATRRKPPADVDVVRELTELRGQHVAIIKGLDTNAAAIAETKAEVATLRTETTVARVETKAGLDVMSTQLGGLLALAEKDDRRKEAALEREEAARSAVANEVVEAKAWTHGVIEAATSRKALAAYAGLLGLVASWLGWHTSVTP